MCEQTELSHQLFGGTGIQGIGRVTNYQRELPESVLYQCYGKPQHIISAHMQELLNLQNKRTLDLRATYDKIMVRVQGYESPRISSENMEVF